MSRHACMPARPVAIPPVVVSATAFFFFLFRRQHDARARAFCWTGEPSHTASDPRQRGQIGTWPMSHAGLQGPSAPNFRLSAVGPDLQSLLRFLRGDCERNHTLSLPRMWHAASFRDDGSSYMTAPEPVFDDKVDHLLGTEYAALWISGTCAGPQRGELSIH